MSAINTIQSVMGINLDTLRPEPSVEGYSTPGGYSSKAVKPIALAKVSLQTASLNVLLLIYKARSEPVSCICLHATGATGLPLQHEVPLGRDKPHITSNETAVL